MTKEHADAGSNSMRIANKMPNHISANKYACKGYDMIHGRLLTSKILLRAVESRNSMEVGATGHRRHMELPVADWPPEPKPENQRELLLRKRVLFFTCKRGN